MNTIRVKKKIESETLHLPELREMIGKTVELSIIESPTDVGGVAALTTEERETALAQLRRHVGALDLGRPVGVDNESIDADLALEYGSNHE